MSEIALDLSPVILVYKDGRVERLKDNEIVPASADDPKIRVQSKDVVYAQESNLSARLYLPRGAEAEQKLPLLVYYHGGGFCFGRAFSSIYHNYLNSLVAEANVVAISVDYRLAPEYPLPVAYDDSWAALKWVASHGDRNGPEEWLNSHADFEKVFLAGDSAGGNIAHHMALRNGQEKLNGINLAGVALIDTYFWGKGFIGNESKDPKKKELYDNLWLFTCPTTSGIDDPWINPIADPNLPRLGCSNVLVFVAEMDILRDRGQLYYEELRKSEWGGKVEMEETKEENHAFHLYKPSSDNSKAMLKKIASFLNDL